MNKASYEGERIETVLERNLPQILPGARQSDTLGDTGNPPRRSEERSRDFRKAAPRTEHDIAQLEAPRRLRVHLLRTTRQRTSLPSKQRDYCAAVRAVLLPCQQILPKRARLPDRERARTVQETGSRQTALPQPEVTLFSYSLYGVVRTSLTLFAITGPKPLTVLLQSSTLISAFCGV